MKVIKIEQEKDSYCIYCVTLTPGFIEKLFGVKERIEKYRDNGTTFTFGGGTKYIREDGETTGNGSYIGESIDKWRRKF